MRRKAGYYTGIAGMMTSLWAREPSAKEQAQIDQICSRNHVLLVERIDDPLPAQGIDYAMGSQVPEQKFTTVYHVLL